MARRPPAGGHGRPGLSVLRLVCRWRRRPVRPARLGSRRGELRRASQGFGGQHRRRANAVRVDVHRSVPVVLRRHRRVQQLGRHRAARGLCRPGPGVLQRVDDAESPTDQTHFVKQAVGVFATNDAADRAFHRVVDRTVGCGARPPRCTSTTSPPRCGRSPAGRRRATDADWVKQEAGTDRRCFTTTRMRENVLLQAKVCQSGNGGPAVNVLAGAMQNTLGQ